MSLIHVFIGVKKCGSGTSEPRTARPTGSLLKWSDFPTFVDRHIRNPTSAQARLSRLPFILCDQPQLWLYFRPRMIVSFTDPASKQTACARVIRSLVNTDSRLRTQYIKKGYRC